MHGELRLLPIDREVESEEDEIQRERESVCVCVCVCVCAGGTQTSPMWPRTAKKKFYNNHITWGAKNTPTYPDSEIHFLKHKAVLSVTIYSIQ